MIELYPNNPYMRGKSRLNPDIESLFEGANGKLSTRTRNVVLRTLAAYTREDGTVCRGMFNTSEVFLRELAKPKNQSRIYSIRNLGDKAWNELRAAFAEHIANLPPDETPEEESDEEPAPWPGTITVRFLTRSKSKIERLWTTGMLQVPRIAEHVRLKVYEGIAVKVLVGIVQEVRWDFAGSDGPVAIVVLGPMTKTN